MKTDLFTSSMVIVTCLTILSLRVIHKARIYLVSVGWHGMASLGWNG
jgi:hypothetical protein